MIISFSRATVLSLTIFFALVAAGCGGPKLAPVSGKVTCGGETRSGQIIFTPIDETKGKSASSTINEDGTYTLKTVVEGDGAVVGQHRVSITLNRKVISNPKAKDQANPQTKYEKLPAEIPENLVREVKEGEKNEINFNF